jgi:predicted DsbA family dithiol-disulfide isomerase
MEGSRARARLPSPRVVPTGEAAAALASEVDDVRRLAPEVAIDVPPGLPNSHLATQSLAVVGRQHRSDAARLRLALSRAVWREGRDISDPTVIDELITATGLEPVSVDEDARRIAQAWHEAWTGSEVGLVPALVADDGWVGRGLLGQEEIERAAAAIRGS